MRRTELDGVSFYEDIPENIQKGEFIKVEIGGVLKSAQLATLKDVKEKMAKDCKIRGYNSIVDFKYGQKSIGFFASIFSRDDVIWYGEGYLANITEK